MAVYQTFVNAMNDRIKRQIAVNNPFVFKHISNLKGIDDFDDIGPCVILASPGMMQSGLSRELFEMWCTDPKNGCIVAGYCVEGTLAKHILSEPEEIQTMAGTRLKLKMDVSYISFSAHTDYKQTSGFIRALRPPHVVLVHGEANEMGRLKAALVREYESVDEETEEDGDKMSIEKIKPTFYNPRNTAKVELFFRGEKMAKVMGSLAEEKPEDGKKVSGILIKRNFNYHIVSPNDITKYTDMTMSTVDQRLSVDYSGTFALLHFMISQLCGDVQLSHLENSSSSNTSGQPQESRKVLRAFGEIDIIYDRRMVVLEWVASPVNDMYADAILCSILQAESMESKPAYIPSISNKEDKMHFKECLIEMLQEMFGDDSVPRSPFAGDDFEVMVDSKTAKINLKTCEVECNEDSVLQQMVETAVSKLAHSLIPAKPNK